MTNLLLRLFIKHPLDSHKGRAAVGSLSGAVGICCNLLLFAMKLAIGILSGSVSITADALNNLSDASGSVVTLIGFRVADKPADPHHPYGHARAEYLSGLAVASWAGHSAPVQRRNAPSSSLTVAAPHTGQQLGSL